MRWVITQNTEILYGPIMWNVNELTTALGQCGKSVVLPDIEPETLIDCEGFIVSPVTETYYDKENKHQKVIGETFTFNNNIVTATPIIVDLTAEELESIPDERVLVRKMYENQYMEATKMLMQAAGINVGLNEWHKLEDKDFPAIAYAAATYAGPTATVALATIQWTLQVLKYDFRWRWEDIEYHPEIVS